MSIEERFLLRSCADSRHAKFGRRFLRTCIAGRLRVSGEKRTGNGKRSPGPKTMESFSQQCSDVTRTRSDFDSRRRLSACLQKMRSGSSMKKQQVDHALRAAGRITGEKQFIIIGSQSLHGKYPDIADTIVRSVEVDLYATENPSRTRVGRRILSSPAS